LLRKSGRLIQTAADTISSSFMHRKTNSHSAVLASLGRKSCKTWSSTPPVPAANAVAGQQAEKIIRDSHRWATPTAWGVTPIMLVQSVELFRRTFSEQLNQTLLPIRQRYRLLEIIDRRLQDQLHAQLEASALCMPAIWTALHCPCPTMAPVGRCSQQRAGTAGQTARHAGRAADAADVQWRVRTGKQPWPAG
jgi:hypothetical protein